MISAALFARFSSRQDYSFAAKVAAALRNQFGGTPSALSRKRRPPRIHAEMATTRENPLLEGLPLAQTPEPCVVVIFGASGDLTKRKIFPAIYALALRRLLPENFAILGAARSDWTDEEFRHNMEAAVREFGRDEFRDDVWERLSQVRLHPPRLRRRAGIGQARERSPSSTPRAAPWATASTTWPSHPLRCRSSPRRSRKMRETDGWTRLIIEKPFGYDQASRARAERSDLARLQRGRGLRIDHYLGKETVQNMAALRFANGIFEPIWNASSSTTSRSRSRI